jgi:hypothetical protein
LSLQHHVRFSDEEQQLQNPIRDFTVQYLSPALSLKEREFS